MPTDEKVIYLTFDDGPIPALTPWVLDALKEHDAKATFFCVGENVDRYPEICKRIVEEGHSLGNHTYNHLNGWQTDSLQYLRNTLKADEVIRQYAQSDLFRPPYGRITRKQREQLRDRRIVMWDVLSGDFSDKITAAQVLERSVKHTVPGSIIVFHDNIKAAENLKFALPRYLMHFKDRGYSFHAL
jgi:peptidoglycan/xylan/chitin deacetylase (PgdA/CDA1 family)